MTREIYTCDFLGVSREILAMQFVITKYGKVSITIAIMEKSETGNVLKTILDRFVLFCLFTFQLDSIFFASTIKAWLPSSDYKVYSC